MTITQHLSVADFPSAREIIAKDSFRACSFAMDDGGRCLLDVISDPLLLQSFLESGSDDNSKDPQDGTSSESAVESPQIPRYPQTSLSNHLTPVEHIIESAEQMGYSYLNDSQGLLSQNAACSIGISLASAAAIVGSSSGPQTFQHASSSRTTIHHLPVSTTPTLHHQHSPATPRPHTPLSHSIRSPGQGPGSVHSMPPPSPLQQTRSPLPSHTPSPAPAWSPAPPVLSPAANRTQSSLPSAAFQQPHNQMLQTTANVTQILTALTSQQNQKFTVQQQQQPILLHPQSPISSPQQPARLSVASPVVTTAAVPVTPSMVQIIPTPQGNVPLPIRTTHSAVRPIQPKLPQQILPKPASSAANQFVAPVVKQTNNTPVTASQRGVNVPLQTGTASQLLIGQGQPGMFSGPQGTIVLNSIIPGMGQSPILIQGNLSNLANLQGLHLTLRPPSSATSSQTLSSSGAQSNPTLIAALQGPNQPAQALFAQTKSPMHGQQTIVIPNNITPTGISPQNLNLTTTAIRNSAIVPSASQGQSFLARSNIILSPRVVGPNQGLQLQQIQTPQGPILALAPSGTIAVPHLPTALQNAALGSPQLGPGTVPMHGVMAAGQGVISGLSLQSHPSHPALHQHHSQQQQSLFGATVPLTSHMEQPSQPVVRLPQAVPTQPITAPISSSQSVIHLQQHQGNLSPKPQSSPKPSKIPSVNLEELLKEHGIVPENTPPPSPDSQSPQNEDAVPTQLQVNNTVVQSPQLVAALQSQHHVVLEQINQNSLTSSSLPQMKLAFAQDGSVILQPHAFISTPRLQHNQTKIGATLNSSVIPTVTTSAISVPIVTTQPCSSRGHSTLLARLNSAPAISIPDVVSSALASSLVSCSSTSITTSTSTVTTTPPLVIPVSVQSLNMSNSPICTAHAVQPFTTVSSVISGQIPIELCSSLPQSVNHTTASAGTTVLAPQNVQSRLNHVIFGFQPLITSTQQQSTVQTVSKTIAGNVSANISVCNSHNMVTSSLAERTIRTEPKVVGVPENNSGAIAPGHKLQAISPVVPNDILQNIQKEITDLSSLKSRTPEQQRTLQRLLTFQQSLLVQTKLSCSQGQQLQTCCKESESEAYVPTVTLPSQSSVITTAIRKNQMQVQTSHVEHMSQAEKQSNALKSNGSQSIHLVNLLKQNSVHNASLRAITPVTISSVNNCDNSRSTNVNVTQVTTQMRLVNPSNSGTSIVQQRHSMSHPLSLPSDIAQPKDSLSRIPQLNQHITSSSTKPSNIINSKAKSTIMRINSACKTALISKQLTVDQNYAITPDTKTPFSSKEDACQRLLKYHVYNSKVPSLDEMSAADRLFERVSVQLLDRFRNMINKYHVLQLKHSMKPCPTPERVLLERLFMDDEKSALEHDRIAVAEGKPLVLPPLPSHWLKDFNTPTCSQRTSDGSMSPLKEDCDHLEAPVIDSCVDIASLPNDVCDRSPPTLKRIVIKAEPSFETDNEDSQSKKRLKIHNSRAKVDNIQWGSNSKMCSKESSLNDNKNVSLKNHNDYRNVTRDEDIMVKLRKELNISPLENDDEESVVPHVDFEPPGCPNGLADFETPIARTDGSCDSSLLTTYHANLRTSNEMKYDFDMLDCPSEWMEAYSNHAPHNAAESEAAVESILSDHNNPSELDLSGIEGLEDQLDDSQQSIPNGIREAEESRDSHLHYISFMKSRGYREDQIGNEGHTNVMQDQVQSAIKSILEFHPDNRSYFDGDDTDIMPRLYELEKAPHESRKRCRVSPVNYGSVDGEISVNSEADAALDEAVRSIMQ